MGLVLKPSYRSCILNIPEFKSYQELSLKLELNSSIHSTDMTIITKIFDLKEKREMGEKRYLK
jgi:hypothetical protein